jgi:photosystem II stability/assembly factor-like uncharacterized protein
MFLKISLIISIFCFGFLRAQEARWKIIANPVDKILRHVQFVNTDTGWAAGEDGTIIRTNDGGQTWEQQITNVQTFIVDLFFLNENVGWALTVRNIVPFGTTILHTTNGGVNWIPEDFSQPSTIMNTIFFFDSLNGFIGGKNISKTTDGGQTWQITNIDSSIVSGLPVLKFKFFSRDFGYACGGFIDLAGVTWKTTDGGNNWAAIGVSPDQVFDMCIIDSLNAISLSGDPEGFYGIGLLKTSDAGNNWSYNELPLFGLSFSLDFRTSQDVWSASGFQFLHSPDGGISWEEVPTPEESVVYDIDFFNELVGFAVGDSGVILKYIPGIINVENNSEVKNFVLDQNYPNPFNPSTKINWQIDLTGKVSLKIYDVLGNEVAKLIDEAESAGNYSIEFSGENLPGGIYFYQLKSGSYSETKKMVLLK